MLIPWLFFLTAILLAVAIVLYSSRKRQRKLRHQREEPSMNEATTTADMTLKAQSADADPVNEDPRNIIVISLLSSSQRPYMGYELLQSLLSLGLRFGKMDIFHRHEHLNGTGEILFSLASAVKPGTFEMSKMGGFTTPGLTLFFDIKTVSDPNKALETMLITAKQLIDDLGGEIVDGKRASLTESTIEEWRQHIRQVEARKQTHDLFAEV